MKIKSVTLTSFGKFKNFSLDYSKAHNIIYSKNEGGKSTIMAFILLMLYGDLKKDIRNKYLPLDGSPMSGTMEIQVGETPYLIEKNFKKILAFIFTYILPHFANKITRIRCKFCLLSVL